MFKEQTRVSNTVRKRKAIFWFNHSLRPLTHNCAGYVTEEVRENGMIVEEEKVKKNKIEDSEGHSEKIMLI
jgi:hypothetical protein